MPDLTNAKKQAIGLDFVLRLLNCKSPYGKAAAKAMRPFAANDFDGPDRHFDNIAAAMRLAKENAPIFTEIGDVLAQFKNITGCVDACEHRGLGHVELFDIKQFLLNFERFLAIYDKIEKIFHDIDFAPMTAALDILDPHSKRVAPFAIEDGASATLANLRAEKAAIEAKLQRDKTPCLLEKRAQIAAAEDAEEIRIMRGLTRQLSTFAPIFRANMDAIGRLDLCMAKAALAADYDAVRPKISTSRFTLKNMANPMIAADLAARDTNLTKTDIALNPGTTIITGANMGGKSVALKTAALNAALCRLGFFVFASEAEIPIFTNICLMSPEIPSDSGLSSFGAEVSFLSEVAAASRDQLTFIALDEPAGTTNPTEGAAIARALATFFARGKNFCLMATHYDNVGKPGMAHYRVAGLLADGRMDYNLIETDASAPAPREALRVCRMMGLDAELLAEIEKEAVARAPFCN